MKNNGWVPLFPIMPAPGALNMIGKDGRPACSRCGTQDGSKCWLVERSGDVYKCCPLHPEQWEKEWFEK